MTYMHLFQITAGSQQASLPFLRTPQTLWVSPLFPDFAQALFCLSLYFFLAFPRSQIEVHFFFFLLGVTGSHAISNGFCLTVKNRFFWTYTFAFDLFAVDNVYLPGGGGARLAERLKDQDRLHSSNTSHVQGFSCDSLIN